MVKKIVVFGATGGTGLELVKQGLEKGVAVTAIVQNSSALPLRHPNLKLVTGNVFHPETFDKELCGSQAVISALGIHKKEPTKVYSAGIKNIAAAMKKAGVSRLICLSAGAVVVPPKANLLTKFITKNILQRLFGHLYSDMLIMEEFLATFALHWTVMRPSWLRNTKRSEKYRVAINESLRNPSKISRADLAHCILRILEDEATFNSVIEISY